MDSELDLLNEKEFVIEKEKTYYKKSPNNGRYTWVNNMEEASKFLSLKIANIIKDELASKYNYKNLKIQPYKNQKGELK